MAVEELKEVTIELTEQQQKQIEEAVGWQVDELTLVVAELSATEGKARGVAVGFAGYH
jgi:hypothetical protein